KSWGPPTRSIVEKSSKNACPIASRKSGRSSSSLRSSVSAARFASSAARRALISWTVRKNARASGRSRSSSLFFVTRAGRLAHRLQDDLERLDAPREAVEPEAEPDHRHEQAEARDREARGARQRLARVGVADALEVEDLQDLHVVVNA